MSISDFQKEWLIRRILRKLSRQRVVLVLQPGDVWVIEKAVEDTEETDSALKTCYMRGWVEPIEKALPRGKLTPEGKLPDGNIFDRTGPFYRLTDSGWSVINRSHQLLLITVLIAVLTLLATLRYLQPAPCEPSSWLHFSLTVLPIPADAVRATDWVISNGLIGHWRCASLTGLLKQGSFIR